MSSLQLLPTVKKGSSFYLSRRKALAVAATALIAGGGLAYAQSSFRSRHLRQEHYDHSNGTATEKETPIQDGANNPISIKTRRKKNGLKSLKALVGILLAQIGRKGTHNILFLAAIVVLRTALSNRLAKVQGFLFRAAFLRRTPVFLRLIAENLILCLLQSAFLSTTKYLTGTLSLHFRKVLTHHIHEDYFQNMTYYKISNVDNRITNPEQRIASDIPRFCSELSDLIREDLTAVSDGLLYTWRLCSYASPKYVLWILAYVTGVGFVIGKLSPAFGTLMSKEQQLEGEYRQLHSRLRSHSESVAFYGGQDREASHIKQRFGNLVRHMSLVLHTNWWFGMIQDFFLKYLGATFAVVLIIEPFFSGNLRPDSSTIGRAEMLSNLRYHTSVIISLFQALGTLSVSSRRLNRLSGYADRIREMMIVARELRLAGGNRAIQNKESGSYFTEASHIEFDGVKVVTPTGNTLVEDLNLKVEPGSNLLITGPNGSGKSSLFRVLGGLWPLVAGRITKPGVGSDLNNEIFYVPQRPYTAFGTLCEQLIYPLTASEATEPITKEGMRELLKNVDLEYLLDRYSPEREVNWGDELSLGEQQRLGMARLFYHKPKFAILDECTSAVTTDMEERFCAKVRAMGTSCITISHRPALVAFHDTVLSLDGEGGWSVHYKREPVSQYCATSEDESYSGRTRTERKNDAMTVQRVFASTSGETAFSDSKSVESHVGEILAKSPPKELGEPVPNIPLLKANPRKMPARVAALLRILVPTLYNKQGAQFFAVSLLVISRTWISAQVLYHRAGPRSEVCFSPDDVHAAIVTCGRLSPGVNTVIRELVIGLWFQYGVRDIKGIRSGYRGFYSAEPVVLYPKLVDNWHKTGGTMLETSKGGFDLQKIVDGIEANGFNQVYIIGGDGTMKGAVKVFEEVKRRGLKVSIAGIPNSVDNDVGIIDVSFGFHTAGETAQSAISAAHVEAESAPNGIGLVKLMGRYTGHIALHSTLGSRDVDCCLIPENPFYLEGEGGLFEFLDHKLEENGHFVLVVAEGAGQELIPRRPEDKEKKDEYGNPAFFDVGPWLRDELKRWWKKHHPNETLTLKYIDPTYMVRAVPANAADNIYCTLLANSAVHGAMAGYTGFAAGRINGIYAYIPLDRIAAAQNVVDVNDPKWAWMMSVTNQPDFSSLAKSRKI